MSLILPFSAPGKSVFPSKSRRDWDWKDCHECIRLTAQLEILGQLRKTKEIATKRIVIRRQILKLIKDYEWDMFGYSDIHPFKDEDLIKCVCNIFKEIHPETKYRENIEAKSW